MKIVVILIITLIVAVAVFLFLGMAASKRANKDRVREIIVLRSSLQTDEWVWSEYSALIEAIEKKANVSFSIVSEECADDDLPKPDFVLVATGGVESLFAKLLPSWDGEITIVADGRNNSLAASLEMLTYLQNNSHSGRIIHGSNIEIVGQMFGQKPSATAKLTPTTISNRPNCFEGLRIACFGEPSDWLIASSVSDETLNRLGITKIKIEIDELMNRFDSVKPDEIESLAADYEQLISMKNVNHDDLVEALRMYKAIKDICSEQHVDALTIRCFDILTCRHTTSCLALALLNDEGIVSACEGDMQSLLSMVFAKRVLGQPAFMANPSIVGKQTTLAHCTLPTTMCRTYSFDTHFESKQGLAIVSMLEPDDYTIFKLGGENLDRFAVFEAKAVEVPYNSHLCRAQVTLNIDLRSYLLNNPIGNHHIIIKGKFADEIKKSLGN